MSKTTPRARRSAPLAPAYFASLRAIHTEKTAGFALERAKDVRRARGERMLDGAPAHAAEGLLCVPFHAKPVRFGRKSGSGAHIWMMRLVLSLR